MSASATVSRTLVLFSFSRVNHPPVVRRRQYTRGPRGRGNYQAELRRAIAWELAAPGRRAMVGYKGTVRSAAQALAALARHDFDDAR